MTDKKPNVYIEPPEGYEVVDYRAPLHGEKWLGDDGYIQQRAYHCMRPILKKKRWRAERGETYFIVTIKGKTKKLTDDYRNVHRVQWLSGNYFQTREEAQIAADAWKNVFNPK